MAKYVVSTYTANRTLKLIAHFKGDLAVARHDVQIGLDSLGDDYTDVRSERVLSLLNRLLSLTPERQAQWLTTLETIAASEVEAVR